MSSRFFREALSLESETGVEQEAIKPMEADLALESATLDITEAAHEVEMLGYQQEELEHAHASLESISASLESLVASDERGLDRVAAEGYQHAITAIVGDALPNPVASLESFGGESECSAATQLSMEGIKDTIKKIWDAIKRSVQNAIKAVSDFFAKLFNGVDKMESKVKSMKDELAKAKKEGYTAQSEKFSAPGADRLEMEGKIDNKVVMEAVKMVNGEALATVGEITKEAEEFYKDLSEFYRRADDAGDADKFVSDRAQSTNKVVESSKVVGKMLPGGKAIMSDSKSDSDKGPSLPTIKIADHPNAKSFSGKAEVDVPELSDIEKMIDEAGKLVGWMKDAKKRREGLVKTREAAVKAAEGWVKEGEKGKLKESWTQAKVNMAMGFANHDMLGNLSRIDNYVFSFARGLVGYADAALKQYGEKKEEKKGDE